MQNWPLNTVCAFFSTGNAASMSASSKIIIDVLPPSSIPKRLEITLSLLMGTRISPLSSAG